MELRWSSVGDVRRRHGGCEPLVLRLIADVAELCPLRPQRGVRIEVHRYAVLLPHLFAEAVGERDGFGHGDAADRHERHDVNGAEARVFAFVRPHVDLGERCVHQCVGRLAYRLGLAGEREDRAVVVGVAGLIEKAHAGDGGDRGGDPRDDVRAPSFADIRYAFDQRCHRTEGSLWPRKA